MEKTTRFNVLKKGIVGVCAATLLTGLCVVPAFAADKATQIYTLDSTAAQISVTVPTGDVKAVLATDGSLTLPSLTLTNGSLAPVFISKVEVSGANAAIKLLSSDAYTTSVDKNATSISMANAGKTIDLGKFTTVGGTDIPQADAVVINGSSGTAELTSTAAMKNFTGAILGQTALSFVTVAFTVSPTTV